MKSALLLFCSAVIALTAAASPAAALQTAHVAPSPVQVEIATDQTVLTFSVAGSVPGVSATPDFLHRLVALPVGTEDYRLELLEGQAVRISSPGGLQSLRGLPVVSVLVEQPQPGLVRVAVHHDGQSASGHGEQARRFSRSLAGALPDPLPENYFGSGAKSIPGVVGGSYVIISDPAFASAMAPLADWKRRKGYPVVLVTTDDTGSSNLEIKNWLQEAYATWPSPPEYVLLVGDIDRVPAWDFSGNVTDHPYARLEGDDFLPDVMLGRFSVADPVQAQTVVHKTLAYERTPHFIPDNDWFTRSLMVAGNSGSTTPVSTAQWCGQQLEGLGFQPAGEVFDVFSGLLVTYYLEEGVSQVVYRGWAYGHRGWEPPHFTVDEIPGVNNGSMTPVVFSFVCLTMDYAATEPCFGEVFLRQGTPTEPKGAVAFVGNGEHWSHTRYNDAMAISFYERITDPEITDLGSLILAGKLRFMDYFPHEMSADQFGEESVEFYFHIYGLLGDPELNFYKATPTSLTVAHDAAVPTGTNFLEVTVFEADGSTPVANARVGVAQDNQVLGCGLTDAAGVAQVALEPVAAGSDVFLTVTHADRVPYETVLAEEASAVFVAVSTTDLSDDDTFPSQGNGDGVPNPGETVEFIPTVTNYGSTSATSVVGTASTTGPVVLQQNSVNFGTIAPGANATAAAPLVGQVEPDAENGRLLRIMLEATSDQAAGDLSQFEFTVRAPDLTVHSLQLTGTDWAEPGQEVSLELVLHNQGDAGTEGGSAILSLDNPAQGTVTDATSTFGQVAPGQMADLAADPFAVMIDPAVVPGSGLGCRLDITLTEGASLTTTFTLLVGKVDVSVPVGPDAFGYYAYDSADFDFPDQVPDYRWVELSPNFGGEGTAVPFGLDNYNVNRVVPLPFTFRYYGEDFDEIRVCDNGWISFDTGEFYDFYNWPMPSEHGNHSLVAPFWDNLNPVLVDSVSGQVGVDPDGIFYRYDPAAGTFTVEWSRMRHYRSEIVDPQTFQVVLYDPAVHTTPTGDGEILFLYRQVNNSDYLRQFATVGIESPSELDGLQLTYANLYVTGAAPIAPGLAIKFTTAPPQYVPYDLASFRANRDADGVRLDWSVRDQRPVLGWKITRLQNGQVEVLTPHHLPGSARNYLDASAGSGLEPQYMVTALHPNGRESEMGPYLAKAEPSRFGLYPCWPNPVRHSAKIQFSVPRSGKVRLRIFDVAGRLVRTLLDGQVDPGAGHTIWDGHDQSGHPAPGGLYFYRLETAKEVQTRKLLLVR